MSYPEAGSDSEDPHRYWKAAISHLPPEKQNAAWEWYRARSEPSQAFDSLSGLLLLLEANAAYLERVPRAVQELLEGASNRSDGSMPSRADLEQFLGYFHHYTTQLQDLLGSAPRQWQEGLQREGKQLAALVSQITEQSHHCATQLQDLLGSAPQQWQEGLQREGKQLAALVSQITEQGRVLQKRLNVLRLWAVGLLLAIGFFAGCSAILLLRLLMPKFFGV
ncbi:hypothetical protein MAMC_00642 [Methylacidimicrobium cyclopophantes]|uniref:Uncharacterized protein n=1 Tax=Methylacidimicrobium cyclopophantes TaxID=1041766 RepID=A0A5E6M7K4_9BACT|nr:hypothetical protein [Methylacidimicrobium cyclopophantes]VVM05520.1 hypothetical protein MAMC_00642 [Methylacidimicrobium cyclopophantes]